MEPALKLFTRQAGSVFDVGAFCKPRMSKIQNLQIKVWFTVPSIVFLQSFKFIEACIDNTYI